MTDPTPLDPDEVDCPRCEAPAGAVCVTPGGAKSRTVHVERRRLAARGGTPPSPPRHERRSTRKPTPPSDEARSRGGKATAQARRRRKAELAAKVEAAREKAEADALEAEAVRLAEDAARYDRDRAIVKRQTLDAAHKIGERLLDAVDHVARPAGYDEQGVPRTKPVEFTDKDGNVHVEEVLDRVGYWSVGQIVDLGKAASVALNALRLEEGKATGITGTVDAGSSLEDVDLERLIRAAGGKP